MNMAAISTVGAVLLLAAFSSWGGDLGIVKCQRILVLKDEDTELLDAGGASGLLWWLSSDTGIRKTRDGGESWQLTGVPPVGRAMAGHLTSVRFFQPNDGVALREQVLYRTVDGGAKWIPLAPVPLGGQGGNISGIHFLSDGSAGWVYGGTYRMAAPSEGVPNYAIRVGQDGKGLILEPAVFMTRDWGLHWTRQDVPNSSGYRVIQLQFADPMHGVAATDSSVLFTHDGGETWHSSRLSHQGPLIERAEDQSDRRCRLVYLFDRSLGWLSFDDGSVYRTTDGGEQWRQVAPSSSMQSQFAAVDSFLVSMAFLSPDLGWGIEASGALYETHNGGAKWIRFSGTKTRFLKFLWCNGSQLVALSEDGLYRLDLSEGGHSR
jgi:photosystem II stability/assembly factor-like uncharacterized protein